MSKYRAVDLRLWNDRRFLSLSDRGKTLWMFFLTSHFSLPIPGVTVAGEVSLADTLGWSVRTYRTVLRELLDKGMKIRVEGKVVWLWNAFSYPSNAPKNPNMVEGWSKSWDDVPECALKTEIWDALRTACDRFTDVFLRCFQHPTSKPSGQLSLGIPPNGYPQGYPPVLPPIKSAGSGSGSETGSEPGAGLARAHARTPARDPTSTVPVPVHPDPEADRRQSVQALVHHGFKQQREAFNRIRTEQGIAVPPMAAVGDSSERALLELVKSWPTLEGAQERIEHVLSVRIDEATNKHTLAFMGASLWKPDNFDRALRLTVGEDPFKRGVDAFDAIDRFRAEQRRREAEREAELEADDDPGPHLALLEGGVS